MPNWMTLLDRAKINCDDQVRPILNDTQLALPELTSLMADDIPGQEFKSLVYKNLPSVRYKKHGVGIDPVVASPELQTFQCHYLPGRIEIPESVADGVNGGVARAAADQMTLLLQSAFNHACRCLYYGTTIDADAPPGLLEVALSSHTISAGGSSGTSSVVLVRSGPMDVSWIFGANGRIQASELIPETLLDANSRKVKGYGQWITAYIGHCIRSPRSVAVVNNVDASHPITDDLLMQAVGKFKASAQPTHIFMSKAAAISYARNRITTYNPNPVVPQTFAGLVGNLSIPILITDALDQDEDDGTTAAELEAQQAAESFITQ